MPLLCPAQQALLRMLPSRASTTWTRRCLRPDMCGTRCVCRKQRCLDFNVSNDVHTLRTPPTANWLKGGVWATKNLHEKTPLAIVLSIASSADQKGKSEPLPKPKKLARPLGKTSTYAKLPTYVAYVEARVAPGVLRPVHCPARRPRPPMALRHSIGRTYRHGLWAGFCAASAGVDPW